MNLDNLQCFLTVCKYKSFTKAAEEMYITQSTVSRKVSSLENELNVCLIERTPSNLQLTRAGSLLFEEGPSLIGQVKVLKEKLKGFDAESTGTIHIGCYGLFFLSLVSIIKENCYAKFPRIKLEFYYDRIKNINEDVANRRADIYISIHCELSHIENYETHSLIKRQLMVFLPKTHDLASLDTMSLSDIKNRPIAFWEEEAVPGFYGSLIDSCREQGFEPLISSKHNRADDIVMELHTKNIMTIMFDKTNVFEGELLKSIKINDSNINVDIGFCYEKNSSNPALQSIVSLLDKMDLSGY